MRDGAVRVLASDSGPDTIEHRLVRLIRLACLNVVLTTTALALVLQR
jgi:hypothetical protein